ncbi:bifunctional DNA-formamidopyrimidine glycosylase/DNA-(apurinic or apyrimidinic site) lyase [Pseudomarimonas arenosa]|uniref:Formamidopyrimidine-DNA glycosylase n=1 Tax=Pseudomarimonas arenosa TaxID=2774145 RepID=A0AAW3ZPW6_9GAMM|nr:bifunctional DNA-formamidopyrimidine glycosylase/DNA-(apurinic or apyrimidinic site) lyase [Pseudomarimonas arenosa]MBD8527998.1 bifunctional DNA-formamidopyrimidine glycosylase/DNA-(apurinic or apyrimidinic site) lyase [Pseudomarimonas arenosa]
MPELPEVETTRRGIEPHLVGRRVDDVVLRRRELRWPIPAEIKRALIGREILATRRRAKYLLLDNALGSAIIHLGMSGVLRVLPASTAVGRHDHIDLQLDSGRVLRFTDPRRFGCLLWQAAGETHPLLAELGPEPLSDDFDGARLFRLSRGRRGPVKNFIMDQATVVGVGNIYAAESLFRAGIDPRRAAGRVSLARYQALAAAIRDILNYAIERGGTTLRDFLNPDGLPGYFEQELLVYGREGLPCRVCATALKTLRLGQRASCYCPRCQR